MNGLNEVDQKVKTPSDELGKFIGQPIKVEENNINPVNNYGSGLAPYFIPISLWLGAVFMFLVIKIKNYGYENMSNVQLVLGKFIPYSIIGLIQAVLLAGVLLSLGIKPKNYILLLFF